MARLPLGDAIARFRDNDERIDIFVNGGENDTYTTTEGEIVPSVQKIIKDAVSVVDLQQIIETIANFTIVVESTAGTAFHVGEAKSTILKGRVFYNGTEITEDLPAYRFRWRRVSAIPQPYPNDDATWNSQFISGYKTISVDVDAIFSRATFFCEITEP